MPSEDSLSVLGLSDQKLKETRKNEALSMMLLSVIEQASNHGQIDDKTGKMLYALATKLPKQFHQHLPLLVDYVASGKINLDSKLNAAMKFVQAHKSLDKDIDCKELEVASGVGCEVSADEIEATVTAIVSQYTKEITSKRYNFNKGPLMGKILSTLKWADPGKVQEELDMQIVILLGPKREEDMKKLPKVKSETKTEKVPVKTEVKSESNDNKEKEFLTMAEFLKTIQFHKPGENYKTDGYIVTPKTQKILEEHLRITGGQVRTRFPPEPNGILHIGHAKAINIDFGYAEANNGICFLRYDDTNPEKEEEKFFSAIKEMVEWLGYKPYKITHSSDYFDQLYEWAIVLINKGLAFVCHQKVEDMRGREPVPSPWRDRPIEESLNLFKKMKMGYFDEGEATLRLKTKLEEGKLDPVAYRIKYVSHHRSKDKWCIYPTYDYTHCLCDSLEHITHSMCTKEFQSRRSSYYWLCNALDIYCPVQWEYGRLNMTYTIVSKRKIKQLIDMGVITNWDDPRLFTLTALRRRGFPPGAINNFCASLGLTGAQISIHPDALDAHCRNVLNSTAQRVMVVLEPLEIEILNFGSSKEVSVPNIPGDDSAGTHSVALDSLIYIESTDFREVDERGYRRLTPNQSVGLRHCGLVITLKSIIKDEQGNISKLKVTSEPATKDNKPKAFIHWVSKPIVCEVRLYERLFTKEAPDSESYSKDINPNSLKILNNSLADPSISSAKAFEKFQFERIGFFSVDPDTTSSKLVFNRTVSLKEDKGKN